MQTNINTGYLQQFLSQLAYLSSKDSKLQSTLVDQFLYEMTLDKDSTLIPQQIVAMNNSSLRRTPQKEKKKYSNISDYTRHLLLLAVINNGENIKDAAKRLDINYSSAKKICRIYRREGRSNKIMCKRKLSLKSREDIDYERAECIGSGPNNQSSLNYSNESIIQEKREDNGWINSPDSKLEIKDLNQLKLKAPTDRGSENKLVERSGIWNYLEDWLESSHSVNKEISLGKEFEDYRMKARDLNLIAKSKTQRKKRRKFKSDTYPHEDETNGNVARTVRMSSNVTGIKDDLLLSETNINFSQMISSQSTSDTSNSNIENSSQSEMLFSQFPSSFPDLQDNFISDNFKNNQKSSFYSVYFLPSCSPTSDTFFH